MVLEFWKLWHDAKQDKITIIPPHPDMKDEHRKLENYFVSNSLDMNKLTVIINKVHNNRYNQARKWLHKIHNPEGRAKLSRYLDLYEQTVKQGNGADQLPPPLTISSNTRPSNTRPSNTNAPNYEADYKDACNTINQLRSELSKVKSKLRNAEHQAKTASAYGKRQFERAEKLQRQLKDTDNISDDAISDYQELKWKYQTLQNEFTSYKQGQKMDYSDAMRMILTGAVVDTNQDSVRGADQLKPADWDDIEKLYLNLGFAKSYIDIWLWDIKNTPAGRIGARYKGKSYDPNMGYYVHRIDGLVHSAYQMIGATQDYIKRGKAGRE